MSLERLWASIDFDPKRARGWWDRGTWNYGLYQLGPDHSALMPAALMIGHHFSISAF
jgi:hypothetical protein